MVMINITNTLTDFTGLRLVGKYDKLLSKEAIAEPGEHMPVSKPGAARDLTMKIWNPPEPVFTKVKALIDEHKPPLPGYAVPGLTAILISKDSLDFSAADLSAVRLKQLILNLGMPGDLLEDGVAALMHGNKNSPSASKAHYHVLSAFLHATALIAAEHNILVAPAFLSDFPLPSDDDEEAEDTEDKDGGGEEGHGDDQAAGRRDDMEVEREEVEYAGTRAAPQGNTQAPPLFDRVRPTGGATAIRPPALGQVCRLVFHHVGTVGPHRPIHDGMRPRKGYLV